MSELKELFGRQIRTPHGLADVALFVENAEDQPRDERGRWTSEGHSNETIAELTKQAKSLSDGDRRTIADYQESGLYNPLNNYLRTGKLDVTADFGMDVDESFAGGFGEESKAWADMQVKNLDEVLERCEIKEPLRVYRGAPAGTMEVKVGQVITDKGFSSTSLSEGIAAEDFSGKGGMLFRGVLPKGSHALYADPVVDLEQQEMILARGSRFKVESTHQENGRTVVQGRYLLAGEEASPKRELPEGAKWVKGMVGKAYAKDGKLYKMKAVSNVEDEPRDSHGRWTKGQDIPAALRPKLRSGLYPKSAELHEAAADPAKLEALHAAVAPKDRGKLVRLMEELRAPAPADLTAAHILVRQAVGEANLAKLSDVRRRMAGWSREDQDAALLGLLRAGKVGMSSPEGRHATTEEERTAWIRDGDQVYGHVYLRGDR